MMGDEGRGGEVREPTKKGSLSSQRGTQPEDGGLRKKRGNPQKFPHSGGRERGEKRQFPRPISSSPSSHFAPPLPSLPWLAALAALARLAHARVRQASTRAFPPP